MTFFEDRLRELASKATPGKWKAVSDFPNYAVWSVETKKDLVQSPSRVNVKNPFGEWTTERNAEHIAFNDPATATLVADVLAAARYVAKNKIDWPELDCALAALDARTRGTPHDE